MTTNRFSIPKFIGLAAAGLLATFTAGAQEGFPSKPIRFVVPYGPGNSVDIMTRLVAGKLNERTGWATVVENKPGGRLIPAMQAILEAPADGHTLLGSASSMPPMPPTVKGLPFDLLKDFEWITRTANLQMMLGGARTAPFENAAQMVAYAKANRGKLRFAAYQAGSGTHLVGELLNVQNGIDMQHVPYKDSGFIADLAAGSVEVAVFSVTTLAPVINSGRARALAVLSRTRSPLFPAVPTAGEQGLPEVDSDVWTGITGKAGTPRAIVNRLNAEINAIVQLPDVRERIVGLGGVPGGETPAAFRAKVADEIDMWTKVVREKNIRAE